MQRKDIRILHNCYFCRQIYYVSATSKYYQQFAIFNWRFCQPKINILYIKYSIEKNIAFLSSFEIFVNAQQQQSAHPMSIFIFDEN